MMSKFFIERPVLANVLAIVLVLIGAVALYSLPVSQYPNIVPPTVQVSDQYPGASPQTVIDTIALPIELQVNGVDNMLYMQSTSAADGTYVLTVTFKIGMDPDTAQVLVQNRVSNVLARCPGGAGAGRVGPEEIDLDPADRHTGFAGRQLRFPFLKQLRDDQSRERAGALAGRWQCQGFRRRRICDADLAGSPEALFLWARAGGCDQGRQAAEPGGRGRTDRHAAGAERPGLSNTPWTSSPGSMIPVNSRTLS